MRIIAAITLAMLASCASQPVEPPDEYQSDAAHATALMIERFEAIQPVCHE